MENDQQNLEENLREPLSDFLPMKEEGPEEQARLDELIAHDPKADVVDLGKLEDLEKIIPAVAPTEVEEKIKDETVKTSTDNDNITLSKNKVLLIKKIAQSLRDSAGQLVELLSIVAEDENRIKTGQTGEIKKSMNIEMASESKVVSTGSYGEPRAASASGYGEPRGEIVEGIFDGEKMVGPDGKTYVVPVNYASKSRLVEGDTLKLIITDSGTFIFKQISPIERRRLVGTLDEGENGEYYVIAEDRRWRVLPASITYYKGESGDEVVILIPKVGMSRWAAVENVVRR